MPKQSLDEKRLDLEVKKLELEVRRANAPFYTKANFWLSSLAAIAAFGAILTGYITGYFDNQKLLNELKSEKLQKEADRLEVETAELRLKKDKLLAQIECYELGQQVNLTFLTAINEHPSNKSKKEIDYSSDMKGIVEIEENISLAPQAVAAASEFKEVCNKIVKSKTEDLSSIAKEIFISAIARVPLLESKKSSKYEGVSSINGIAKIFIGNELKTELVNEEWYVAPYETWEERIKPFKEIARRKNGFLNTYLDKYFLEDYYTDHLKNLFWPEGDETTSTRIRGRTELMEMIKETELDGGLFGFK